MHVLMCAGFYDVGGFSTVMEKLADKLVEKGHEVTIAALMFKRFPSKGNYTIARIPVGNPLKLSRFLDDFDVIHNHHAITNYLALVTRKPFVYHYHGAPNFGTGYLFKLSMLSSIKLMKHFFASVIAVSESGAAELKQHYNLDNVHVVYNGVDTTLFKPGLEEKFRKNKPQFLFVGNLYEHKNVRELILGMTELVKTYPKAYLQIVGYGRLYNVLKRFVNELKLENHVELVGQISGSELPYYYASCDVYVTASHWELFGLPLIEAMACGKPVVASSIAPHVTLLTKAKAGLTYTLGDIDGLNRAISAVYASSSAYGSNGVSFAREHDWGVVVDEISQIYSEISLSCS